jgi:hypothetical protein
MRATYSPYPITRDAGTCPHRRTDHVNYRQTACRECGAMFAVIHEVRDANP